MKSRRGLICTIVGWTAGFWVGVKFDHVTLIVLVLICLPLGMIAGYLDLPERP